MHTAILCLHSVAALIGNPTPEPFALVGGLCIQYRVGGCAEPLSLGTQRVMHREGLARIVQRRDLRKAAPGGDPVDFAPGRPHKLVT